MSHVSIDERDGASGRYDFVNCTKGGRRRPRAGRLQRELHAADSVYRVQRPDGTAYRLNPDGTATPIARVRLIRALPFVSREQFADEFDGGLERSDVRR